jgi:hypothetical protein
MPWSSIFACLIGMFIFREGWMSTTTRYFGINSTVLEYSCVEGWQQETLETAKAAEAWKNTSVFGGSCSDILPWLHDYIIRCLGSSTAKLMANLQGMDFKSSRAASQRAEKRWYTCRDWRCLWQWGRDWWLASDIDSQCPLELLKNAKDACTLFDKD